MGNVEPCVEIGRLTYGEFMAQPTQFIIFINWVLFFSE
jgi:hypothetical protein